MQTHKANNQPITSPPTAPPLVFVALVTACEAFPQTEQQFVSINAAPPAAISSGYLPPKSLPKTGPGVISGHPGTVTELVPETTHPTPFPSVVIASTPEMPNCTVFPLTMNLGRVVGIGLIQSAVPLCHGFCVVSPKIKLSVNVHTSPLCPDPHPPVPSAEYVDDRPPLPNTMHRTISVPTVTPSLSIPYSGSVVMDAVMETIGF